MMALAVQLAKTGKSKEIEEVCSSYRSVKTGGSEARRLAEEQRPAESVSPGAQPGSFSGEKRG